MKLKTSTILFILLAFSVALAISGCTSSPGTVTSAPASTPTVASGGSNYSITITGGNASPVTVTFADLKAMGMVEMKNVSMVKMNGVVITSDWKGVRLSDILSKAGVPGGNVTLKMSAPDGYVMAYTSEELNGAMLGLARNGTSLTDDVSGDYPIQLVVPDGRGAQWIKVPVKIDIEK